MLIIDNLLQVANQIETERGIDKEKLYLMIESALESACKKKLNSEAAIHCQLNTDTGKVLFFYKKRFSLFIFVIAYFIFKFVILNSPSFLAAAIAVETLLIWKSPDKLGRGKLIVPKSSL